MGVCGRGGGEGGAALQIEDLRDLWNQVFRGFRSFRKMILRRDFVATRFFNPQNNS